MCHINFHPFVNFEPEQNNHHHQKFEYLSNMTPHSVLYNETLLRLRRTKRGTTSFLNGSHDSINKMRYINDEGGGAGSAAVALMHGVNQMTNDGVMQQKSTVTQNDNKKDDGYVIGPAVAPNSTAKKDEHHNKINTEKHWRYVKNKIRQKIKFIDSHNQPPIHANANAQSQSMSPSSSLESSHVVVAADCHRVNTYAWLFIFAYVLFAFSLFSFLVLSESTVFTVTIMTSALPLIGIFWSFFELQTRENAGRWYIFLLYYYYIHKVRLKVRDCKATRYYIDEIVNLRRILVSRNTCGISMKFILWS